MCDTTTEYGAVVDIHVEATLFPRRIYEFKEGRGEKGGEDGREGGTLGGAMI